MHSNEYFRWLLKEIENCQSQEAIEDQKSQAEKIQHLLISKSNQSFLSDSPYNSLWSVLEYSNDARSRLNILDQHKFLLELWKKSRATCFFTYILVLLLNQSLKLIKMQVNYFAALRTQWCIMVKSCKRASCVCVEKYDEYNIQNKRSYYAQLNCHWVRLSLKALPTPVGDGLDGM